MPAPKTLILGALVLAAAVTTGLMPSSSAPTATSALLGHELRESKEELKLNYDVKVQDNGGGRMSVVLTLADEGRIKPVTSVQWSVPSKDGSGYYDVVATLSPFERDGKKVYALQMTRDLAERGEIDLITQTLDGKRILDWAFHAVRLRGPVEALASKPKADAPTLPAPR